MNNLPVEKRNYWIISSEYPPDYGGGIGTFTYHTARMLYMHGWSVTVFVPAKSGTQDKIRSDDGVRIVEFYSNRVPLTGYLGYEASMAYDFAHLIGEYLPREGVPEILESQEYAAICYYILQFKHLNYPMFRELRVLLTLHAPSFFYYDLNRVPFYRLPYYWIGEMEKWCMQSADMLNAPSRYIAEIIKPYFFSPLKPAINIIKSPYEFDQHSSKEEENGNGNWIFFGKLTPQKGIVPLLKVFRNLWQQGWTGTLLLIGGGDHLYHPEKNLMSEWIKSNYEQEISNGKLKLLGNLSPEAHNSAMRGCKAILIPSLGDNFPYTMLEAMGAGRIILASSQGGQSELIRDGENAFLFDHEAEGNLEEKIRLIDSLSPEEIQEIRHNAVETVSRGHNYHAAYHSKEATLHTLAAMSANRTEFPYTRDFPEERMKKNVSEETLLLTVVIPYFNMGNYIEETLNSVLHGDYPSMEILVVDDGSDEVHREKIRLLNSTFPFRLISQKNQGLAAARNTGAKAAKGEYLAFLDADDLVDHAYYSKCIKIIQAKENVFFAGSWVKYFENTKGYWPAFTPEFPYLLYSNMVCSGGLVFEKKSFLAAGLNDATLEYGLEDWESVISMTASGFRGVVIPEPLYHYRIRKGSMARKMNATKQLYSTRYICAKHRTIYAIFAAEIIALQNANGPGYLIGNPTIHSRNYGILFQIFPFFSKILNFIKRKPYLKKATFRLYTILKKMR